MVGIAEQVVLGYVGKLAEQAKGKQASKQCS